MDARGRKDLAGLDSDPSERALLPGLALAGALLLSSCCQPCETSLSLEAVFEFHHELLKNLPDNVEGELVGFPTHEKRTGLEASYSSEHARTWDLYHRMENPQELTLILIELRAYPAGSLPRDRHWLTWKGLEIEVLHLDKSEEAANLLKRLKVALGKSAPEDYVHYFFFEPGEKGSDPHFGDIIVYGNGTVSYQHGEGKRLALTLPPEEVSTLFSDLIRLGILDIPATEGQGGFTGSARPGYNLSLNGLKRHNYYRSESSLPSRIRQRFILLFQHLDPSHWMPR